MNSRKTESVTNTAFGRSVKCKYCSGVEIVRHGWTVNNTQRYQCRDCNRTFIDNGAPPGMRFQTEIIASTLNNFYEGASLGRIKRHIQLEYGVQPDHASIHRWIMSYTKMAVAGIGQPALVAGDDWVALSSTTFTYFAKGQKTRNLDVVDLASGFLLGTHMDFGPSAEEGAGVIADAARTALRWPTRVLTNSLEFLPLERGWNSPVYPMNGFDPSCIEIETPPKNVARVRGWLRDRASTLAGLASPRTAALVLNGWMVHYNYFRPHPGFDGRTPAVVAGVRGRFGSWADVVGNSTGVKLSSIAATKQQV